MAPSYSQAEFRQPRYVLPFDRSGVISTSRTAARRFHCYHCFVGPDGRALGSVCTQHGVQHVETIETGIVWQLLLGQFRQARCQVDSANDFVADAWLDSTSPTGDERCPCATFVNTVLAARIWTGGAVAADLFDRPIFVSVIQNRTIIATEYDQRSFSQLQSVERSGQFSDTPVKLNDRVTAKSERGLPLESLVRHPRHVNVMRRKEQKEGFLLMLFDELN